MANAIYLKRRVKRKSHSQTFAANCRFLHRRKQTSIYIKKQKFLYFQVLCELQVALVERQLSSRPDVSRDIMKSEFRTVSSSETYRNLRDWLIFRDYMNGLEYVVQVFEHLRRGLQS